MVPMQEDFSTKEDSLIRKDHTSLTRRGLPFHSWRNKFEAFSFHEAEGGHLQLPKYGEAWSFKAWIVSESGCEQKKGGLVAGNRSTMNLAVQVFLEYKKPKSAIYMAQDASPSLTGTGQCTAGDMVEAASPTRVQVWSCL